MTCTNQMITRIQVWVNADIGAGHGFAVEQLDLLSLYHYLLGFKDDVL